LRADAGRDAPRPSDARSVDIRYVVTSLKGLGQYLYETVYCQARADENLIKLHKPIWRRTAFVSLATAIMLRLGLHT